jgi:L-ascorbate metabolism protein UlaG (beta-lactamase superfamily)
VKLTKYVHACVLIEDDQHTALFDPGDFTYKSGLLNIDKIPKLDFVLITHEHFDHFSEPLIQQIIAKFPEVIFYTNQSVAGLLNNLGAKNVKTESDDVVSLKQLEHQSMDPLAPVPSCENVEIHYKNFISHPGDSHQLQKSLPILFVPLAGPWGATIDGVRMADRLKPKVIVPVHDWMWNDEWKGSMYSRIEEYFSALNVRVLKPVDGQTIEIDV